MSTTATRLYGVTGYPLAHSLSPLLHNWAFSQAGIPALYLAWPVAADRFDDFITAMRILSLAGASVTIPHKEAAFERCEILTEAAQAVGAVNTLYWEDGSLAGDNTDLAGFIAPLHGRSLQSALALGAGGAARAVLAGLATLRVKNVYLTNRSPERCAALAAEFDAIIVPWEERADIDADLLVNCTPLGMSGERVSHSAWPQNAFRAGQIAYDLVYNPLETRFLREARGAGCETIDGLTMFIGQAQAQFQRWSGSTFEETQARVLLLEALGAA